jgi:hypothetical protein
MLPKNRLTSSTSLFTFRQQSPQSPCPSFQTGLADFNGVPRFPLHPHNRQCRRIAMRLAPDSRISADCGTDETFHSADIPNNPAGCGLNTPFRGWQFKE